MKSDRRRLIIFTAVACLATVEMQNALAACSEPVAVRVGSGALSRTLSDSAIRIKGEFDVDVRRQSADLSVADISGRVVLRTMLTPESDVAVVAVPRGSSDGRNLMSYQIQYKDKSGNVIENVSNSVAVLPGMNGSVDLQTDKMSREWRQTRAHLMLPYSSSWADFESEKVVMSLEDEKGGHDVALPASEGWIGLDLRATPYVGSAFNVEFAGVGGYEFALHSPLNLIGGLLVVFR